MEKIDKIGEEIRAHLEEKTTVRDQTLQQSRALVRCCSKAIRAAHRDERDEARALIDEAERIVTHLEELRHAFPDLYYAGYTQSALKEFAEASIVYNLLGSEPLPDPAQLNVGYSPYLGGLGEAVGELRRRILDILRHDSLAEAERLLDAMDEIYGLLVTMDFPDAITGNLRRTTDMVRGVTERTRGDLTTTFQQQELKSALDSVSKKLDRG
jgi:translin